MTPLHRLPSRANTAVSASQLTPSVSSLCGARPDVMDLSFPPDRSIVTSVPLVPDGPVTGTSTTSKGITMHDSAVLGLRLALGGYLAVHGAQKLFGSFDGPGLDQAAAGFEYL